MKVKQLTWPFDSPINLGLSNARFVQIGIERPKNRLMLEACAKDKNGNWISDTPSSEIPNSQIILTINQKKYTIGTQEILEFENLNLSNLSISIDDPNPKYLIINIAYE